MRTNSPNWIKKACLSVIVVSTAALTPVLAGPPQRLADLGTANADASFPTSYTGPCINASGQILGQTTINASLSQFGTQAFLYSKGILNLIPPISGVGDTIPVALNASGQALVQCPEGSAFVYHNGLSYRVAPLLERSIVTATAINGKGQVIGTSDGRGFIWDMTNGMVDLGTISPSADAPNFGSTPKAINQDGLVTGYANSGAYIQHAFVFDGVIHDLGTLNGDPSGTSMAIAINDSGQVAGTSDAGTVVAPSSHGFVWDNKHGMRDLGTLWPALELSNQFVVMSTSLGINAEGQIIGTSTLVDLTTHDVYMFAFLWTPGGKDGVPGNTQMKPLALPGALGSMPTGINDNGQVIGVSSTNTSNQHAFLYSNGKIKDLTPAHAGPTSTPMAINASGQVVGSYDYSKHGQLATHPFIYNGGASSDPGTLGGDYSVAYGINDQGFVAGSSNLVSGSGLQHAWVTGPVSH